MPYIILFILFIFSEFTYAGCENGDCHNGYGTYIWFNGDTDDRSWSHGDKFIGYFKDGKMHGQGSYFYTNGNVYVGNYFNGNKHGYGIMKYSSGEKFSGYFKNNLRHGKGTFTDINGKEKLIEYRNGNVIKK